MVLMHLMWLQTKILVQKINPRVITCFLERYWSRSFFFPPFHAGGDKKNNKQFSLISKLLFFNEAIKFQFTEISPFSHIWNISKGWKLTNCH